VWGGGGGGGGGAGFGVIGICWGECVGVCVLGFLFLFFGFWGWVFGGVGEGYQGSPMSPYQA